MKLTEIILCHISYSKTNSSSEKYLSTHLNDQKCMKSIHFCFVFLTCFHEMIDVFIRYDYVYAITLMS